MGAAKYLLKKALTKGKETLENEFEKLEDDPEAYLDEKMSEGEQIVEDVSERTEELLDEYAEEAGYADLEEARQEYGLSEPGIDVYDEVPEDVDEHELLRTEDLVELDDEAQDDGRAQVERKADALVRTKYEDDAFEFAVAPNMEDDPVKVEFYREA